MRERDRLAAMCALFLGEDTELADWPPKKQARESDGGMNIPMCFRRMLSLASEALSCRMKIGRDAFN